MLGIRIEHAGIAGGFVIAGAAGPDRRQALDEQHRAGFVQLQHFIRLEQRTAGAAVGPACPGTAAGFAGAHALAGGPLCHRAKPAAQIVRRHQIVRPEKLDHPGIRQEGSN